MNERIKELADKANAWYPMGYPSGEGGDAAWENLVIFEKEDLEKFAESIVKECVGVCLDRHNTWRWDNERDSDSGPRDCARSIQEHFGVKE